MPAKNPNRERSFNSRNSVEIFKNMINNSSDTQKQKQLIENETDPHLKVQNINTEDIIFNKNNTVFNSDDTEEEIISLAESIDAYGLLHPINVVRTKDNKYLLLDGERRTKAFKHLHRRRISAFVYDTLEEYKQRGILYHANLLNRNLDDRKRFFAFKELKEYYESLNNSEMSKGAMFEEIAKLLGIAKRSVDRLERILKNASDNDLMLLEQGELTFDEFKKRTYKLIAQQTKEQDQRKNILAQGAENVNYIDKNTNTVYLVDIDKNNNNYCTFLTNNSMYMVGFHTPSLPYRKDRQRAQVDLDIVATNNMWAVYEGDLSEYKEKTNQISVEEKDTVNENKFETQDTNKSATPSTFKNSKNAKEISTVSDPNKNQYSENKINTNSQSEKTQESETDKINISLINNQVPDVENISSEKEDCTENNISADISTYTGYTIYSNQRIDGPLWIAQNGKSYILHNMSVEKNIGNGKFEVVCIAEEVNPNTIQRIDI